MMKAKNSKAELLTAKTSKLFIRYLVPGVAATLMVSINYFVDTLCVGLALGNMSIAALNVAQPAPGILYGLGYLFGVGGSTLYSSYLGKGEEKRAKAVYTTCFISLVGISLAIMAAGLGFLGQITTFFGGVGSIKQEAQMYLLFVFLFTPFFAIETFMVTFTRNDNTPKLSLAATMLGCGTNIVLDIVFLFVLDLGILGASLATSLAVLVSSLILLGSTLRKKSGLKLRPKLFSIKQLVSSFNIGVPSFLLELTGSVVTLTFNRVLLAISGASAISAYGVIASLSLVVTSGLAGVSNAMQPLVSVNAGAGKTARVKSFLKMAIVSSFGLALFFTLIGELWPHWLINIFGGGDANFMGMAVPGIRIVFMSFVLVAANILIGVYFQSVQCPAEALALTVLRGVFLPVATVTGCAMFLGVTGVWVSTIVAEALALLFALWLFARVNTRQRAKNYSSLQYFGKRKAQTTIEEILSDLGAEEITTFHETIEKCNACDENFSAVPAFIGLDDLTSEYEGAYTPAYDDEDMGLFLAVGALLFTDLCEQNEQYTKDKQLVSAYPAAAPAMSALARKYFRFEYDEDTEETTIIPFLGYNPESEQQNQKERISADEEF